VENLDPALVGSLLDASMPYLSAPDQASGKVETEHGYYLYDLPEAYDPLRPWPLMISLHGNPPGHCVRVHYKYWNGEAARMGLILVSPNLDGGRWRREEGETMLLEALADAATRFHVDWTRIYLSGYSAGGSGTWIYGVRYADLFAGILVRCGLPRANPNDALNLKGKGVYVVHATGDEKCPVDQTREAVRDMRSRGIEILYEEFPGGHDFFPETTAPALRYLLAFTNPEPSSFTLSGPFDSGRRMVHNVAISGGERHKLSVERGDAFLRIDVSRPEGLESLEVFFPVGAYTAGHPVAVTLNGRTFEVLPQPSTKAFVSAWSLYPFHAAGNPSRVAFAGARLVESGRILEKPISL